MILVMTLSEGNAFCKTILDVMITFRLVTGRHCWLLLKSLYKLYKNSVKGIFAIVFIIIDIIIIIIIVFVLHYNCSCYHYLYYR